jgi:hypothetical protein
MMYDTVGDMISVARIILLNGKRLFLLMRFCYVYVNTASVPPTVVINRM